MSQSLLIGVLLLATFRYVLVQGQPELAQESSMLSYLSASATRLRRDQRGATAVEYGIMVALIAVVIIVAVTLLGGTLFDTFTQIQCTIGGGTYTAGADAGAGTCAAPAGP